MTAAERDSRVNDWRSDRRKQSQQSQTVRRLAFCRRQGGRSFHIRVQKRRFAAESNTRCSVATALLVTAAECGEPLRPRPLFLRSAGCGKPPRCERRADAEDEIRCDVQFASPRALLRWIGRRRPCEKHHPRRLAGWRQAWTAGRSRRSLLRVDCRNGFLWMVARAGGPLPLPWQRPRATACPWPAVQMGRRLGLAGAGTTPSPRRHLGDATLAVAIVDLPIAPASHGEPRARNDLSRRTAPILTVELPPRR